MKLIYLFTLLLCLPAAAIVPPDANNAQPILVPNIKFNWNLVELNNKPYLPINDLKKFFGFGNLDINGKKIKLNGEKNQLLLTTGTQTMLLNGVKFILSEPIRLHNDVPHISNLDLRTLIDPLLRPERQLMPPMKTVVIDAGHGGKDKGSAKLESKYTLALALQIKDALNKKGYPVVLTREKDVFVPLADRVIIANNTADAVVVSLHFNSGPKRAHGFESFILSARQARDTHAASLHLTTAIHSRCLMYLNRKPLEKIHTTVDRGIKRARFNVLFNCKHPAVIIEAGFLTHKKEAEKVAHEIYQQQLTNAIVRGIEVYQNSLQGRK